MNTLTSFPSPCTLPTTRSISIPYQPTLSILLLNTLLTHPLNPPSQPTLLTHPLYTPYQHPPFTKVPIDKSPLRAMARGSQIACAIIAVLLQLGHWKATRNLATEPRPIVLTGETLDRRKRP